MVIAELMIPSAQFALPKIPSMPEPTPWGPFHEQRIYNRRRDIHAVYGGQQQGGIYTPSRHAVIIVFTGSSGEQHGYADGWSPEGVFRYFGEGQVGDMVFERGNRAIRDHLVDGKDLLVRPRSYKPGASPSSFDDHRVPSGRCRKDLFKKGQ